AACGLHVVAAAAHFHEVDADEADVDDVAGDTGDLYAVTDTNAVASDEEEIACHGENHVLQRHRDACGNQSGEGSERADFSGQRKCNGYSNHEPEHDSPQQQKLIAPAKVVDVAESRALP